MPMTNDDIPTVQALSLIVQACDQNEAYISQLEIIDRPHAVLNEAVRIFLSVIPYEQHDELAAMLRQHMDRYVSS